MAVPAHLKFGRGSAAGPQTGGYITFTLGPRSVIANDDLFFGFEAPCDMRLEQISWQSFDASPTNTLTIDFYSHPTAFQTSGATRLHASTNINLQAAPNGTVGNNSSDTDALAASSARNIDKGTLFFTNITADGTGTIDFVTVTFTFYVLDHVNTSAEDD